MHQLKFTGWLIHVIFKSFLPLIIVYVVAAIASAFGKGMGVGGA